MPKPAANFHFIPQIYPAGERVTALRRLTLQFIRIDIQHPMAKPVAEREVTRVFMNLLASIGGFTGFFVRSTLR